MRGPADRDKIEEFMTKLGARVRGAGKIYLTGGTTAVLEGWRDRSIDVDLKADPEPAGLFEAILQSIPRSSGKQCSRFAKGRPTNELIRR